MMRKMCLRLRFGHGAKEKHFGWTFPKVYCPFQRACNYKPDLDLAGIYILRAESVFIGCQKGGFGLMVR